MCGIIVCFSAVVLGVDYGWQPVAGGGIEYIIQIEPDLLDSLKAGHDLFSDLPPAARNIRSYRITVGSGRLPHHGEPPPDSAGPKNEVAVKGIAAEVPAPVADVDLSQLPGPILGPALVLQPPANRVEDNEPPRLAENEPPRLVEGEAEPLANRVAGYHGRSDVQPYAEDDQNLANENQSAAKSHSPDKNKTPGTAVAKSAGDNHEKHDPEEHESPSDRAPAAPQTASSPAAMQLGLFASLCGNAFLLWVAAGQRSSYRALVRRMFESRTEEVATLPRPSLNTPRFEQITAKHSGDSPSEADQATH